MAFLESSEAQDRLDRTRKYGNGLVVQVLFRFMTVINQSLRLSSLVGILFWIEPLLLAWLCLFALPYLIFKWQIANRSFAMQHRRTLKNRWTHYFIYPVAHYDYGVKVFSVNEHLERAADLLDNFAFI